MLIDCLGHVVIEPTLLDGRRDIGVARVHQAKLAVVYGLAPGILAGPGFNNEPT